MFKIKIAAISMFIFVATFYGQFQTNSAIKCYFRNGTDESAVSEVNCQNGTFTQEMCYKFQCNARVVKGCGGYNDSFVKEHIPDYDCPKGWRFVGNCTENLCNGAVFFGIRQNYLLWMGFGLATIISYLFLAYETPF